MYWRGLPFPLCIFSCIVWQILYHYCHLGSPPPPPPPLNILVSFPCRLIDRKCAGLFLGSLFCFTDLYVCLDYCSFVATYILLKIVLGNSLAVQWLKLSTFTAKDPGSISGQGTKTLQAMWHGTHTKRIVLAIPCLLHFVLLWILGLVVFFFFFFFQKKARWDFDRDYLNL